MEYKGKGVSEGKALGKAIVLGDIETPLLISSGVSKKEEVAKVSSVLLSLIKEYEQIIDEEDKDSDVVALAKSYKLMVSSPSLYEEITQLIFKKNYGAAKAVEEVLTTKERKVATLESDYARDKANDIRSIKKRIINKLVGEDEINLSTIDYDFILVSKEVTPAMLLSSDPNHIKGIVSEIGSKTSHVAVLSKDIGIPVVFNIPNIGKKINDKEIIYVDGNDGVVVDSLDRESTMKYQVEIAKNEKISKELEEMKGKKATTIDGKVFEVRANASNTHDLEQILSVKLDGVGLFRSESLYLNCNTPPSEEMQFNVYKAFASSLSDKPFIIRTIDIGGDKKSSFFNISKEDNPFLGYRAIRYCLDHKEIFKTQLRAILRASNYGNVMIMYPMISSLEEVRAANAILREAMAELKEEEVAFDEDIKVGIMVEVPAVAIGADLFTDEVDFFSIGTNDLVQYSMAVDRTNCAVTKVYDAFNPGVIRLIKRTIEVRKENMFVSMCGEMAADPLYIILLVGLGLDEFSVNINSVLRVKKYVSLLNSEECKRIVEHILTLKTGTKIKSYLEEYAKEAFDSYL